MMRKINEDHEDNKKILVFKHLSNLKWIILIIFSDVVYDRIK